MRNRKETPPLKETYMDEIRKFGPKRNLHRILRFRQNGSKRNLHTFGENGAKRREKNRIFRHKNEFHKGETWYFKACRAKRGEKILNDFQRFLGPKRNLHDFWKTRILARKGTYIKSRFWILKGGGFFSVLHGTGKEPCLIVKKLDSKDWDKLFSNSHNKKPITLHSSVLSRLSGTVTDKIDQRMIFT